MTVPEPAQNAESVAVDPGDLYTILRCVFTDDHEYSQAEYQAAGRLNAALAAIGWGAQIDGSKS